LASTPLDVVFQGSNGYASSYTDTAQLSEATTPGDRTRFSKFGRLAGMLKSGLDVP
jgi:hypothetical protein